MNLASYEVKLIDNVLKKYKSTEDKFRNTVDF